MEGLRPIEQIYTRGDDGRSHIVYAYASSRTPTLNRGLPHFITNDGWEAARIRDGVFRVYGTGLILRELRTEP